MTENSLDQYYGFYTNKSFWAEAKPDLNNVQNITNLSNIMSEVVAEYDEQNYKMRICRDGLVLFASKYDGLPLENILEYLNTLCILFQSEAQKWLLNDYFEVQELDSGKVIPHTYSGNIIKGFNSSRMSSETLHNYNARFLPFYIPLDYKKLDINQPMWSQLLTHTVNNDPRIKSREGRVWSIEMLDGLNASFSNVVTNYVTVKLLSQLAKVVEEYKKGKFDVALVLAWFIIEGYIYRLYQNKIVQSISPEELNDISVSEALKALNQKKILAYELVGNIHEIRILRNVVVHSTLDAQTPADQVALALNIIVEFIKLDKAINLNLNY
jgi:hypothetical protein